MIVPVLVVLACLLVPGSEPRGWDAARRLRAWRGLV